MAISAQRFKYLDKENNIPTLEFNKLSDNYVYNDIDEISDSMLEGLKKSKEIVDQLNTTMFELAETISSASEEVMFEIKKTVDDVIDSISEFELPPIAKDALDFLKKTDLGGLKNFLKEVLEVGKFVLCNNLDFLKLFMLGVSINKNILTGLLFSLLFSWLDRLCREYSKEEMDSLNPLSSLEKIIPPSGATITVGNVLDKFSKNLSDHLKLKVPIALETPILTTTFLSDVKLGKIESSINNLRNSEISYNIKERYLRSINDDLNNYSPSSTEYKNLLKAKGDLINTPMIHTNRRDKNIKYSNLSDQLGDLAKKVVKINIDAVSINILDETTKNLHNKLVEFKNNVKNSHDLLSRSSESGAYSDFDFDRVLPNLGDKEKNYLLSLENDSTAHRVHDLHPTTGVFIA